MNALMRRKSKGVSYEYDLYMYHRSEEFRLLCQSSLPGQLAESHPGCVALCLSLSRMHTIWLREALIESQKKLNPGRFRKETTRELSIVEEHNEVNRFLGWAIYSVMEKLKKQKDCINNRACRQLLSNMLLRSRQMDDEYVEKYYDINMALLNNGGLTLVDKLFFEWGKQVMCTIRKKFNIGILELDPKNAFEKAKKSILDEKLLKARFMDICNINTRCSEAVATEVYFSILTKTIHARFAAVFRFWKEQNVKKNGTALRMKLKVCSDTKTERNAKRAKLNDDRIGNAKAFSVMIVNELKEACRQRGLIVGGKKDELIERLNKYVLEHTQTVTSADSQEHDEFDFDFTDEDLTMMP